MMNYELKLLLVIGVKLPLYLIKHRGLKMHVDVEA
jgi:hypothetical protein